MIKLNGALLIFQNALKKEHLEKNVYNRMYMLVIANILLDL